MNDTSSTRFFSSPCRCPFFAPDWHPQLAERLSVFPRFIASEQSQAAYWPDLAGFLEDATARQLAYYRSHPADDWILVAYEKNTCRWQVLRYAGLQLLFCGEGASLAEVLGRTVSAP